MIDNIINSYLGKHKRLVIPEFGAFIRKDGGDIVFVEFLKKDDQVLTSLLRADYGLSEAEAHEAVGEYVLGIKRTVGATGKYVIEGVGTIVTDANGLYALQYDPLVRKEPEQERLAAPPVQEETAPQIPRMEVFSVRDEEPRHDDVPSVSHDIIMEPKTQRPAKETTARPKRENTVEFTYREVPVEPVKEPEKKAFTLNDLYSVPATETPSRREPELRPRAATPRQTVPAQPAEPRMPQTARPRPVNYRGGKRKNKTDIVMIIAVIAALIAIGSLIFGLVVKNDPVIKTTKPQTEQTEGVTDGQESVEELLEGQPTADQ